MPDSSSPIHHDLTLIAVDRASQSTSMADLIAFITADDDLTAVRRRNVASSIRRFCEALDCKPEEAPATFAYYRDRLARFHPLAAAIQKKRWATIRSDVSFALKRTGASSSELRRRTPLAQDWQDLKEQLAAKQFRWGLSRLAHFCSARHLAP